ncbi:MAG: hypothetical protein RL240_2611 [Planctomycetota bacterium]|jgi:hypothetical protein
MTRSISDFDKVFVAKDLMLSKAFGGLRSGTTLKPLETTF